MNRFKVKCRIIQRLGLVCGMPVVTLVHSNQSLLQRQCDEEPTTSKEYKLSIKAKTKHFTSITYSVENTQIYKPHNNKHYSLTTLVVPPDLGKANLSGLQQILPDILARASFLLVCVRKRKDTPIQTLMHLCFWGDWRHPLAAN